MKRLGLIGFIAAISSPGLAATNQFDLECQGDTAPKPNRVRVDLDKRIYCMGECSFIESIFSFSPDEILFSDKKKGLEFNYFRVDRRNGRFAIRYQSLAAGKFYSQAFEGTCLPKPFTEFPQRAF